MVKIYALLSKAGVPRYVGKTVQTLNARVRTHFNKAKRGSDQTPKGNWLAGIRTRPEAITLAEVNDERWREAERRWIKRLTLFGYDLLNVTAGGDGSHEYGSGIEVTEELVARLGEEPDSKIAEDLGVTRKAITYHRKKRGIAASNDRTRIPPPPPMGGHNRIELPEEVREQFGEMPDHELAEQAGVSKKVITKRRNAAGVASYAEQTGQDGQFSTSESRYSRDEFPEELIEKMGTMPDTEIGREYGVQAQLVTKERNERGILAYNS